MDIDQAPGILKLSRGCCCAEHGIPLEPARPIYGHVAFDNLGSQKVPERCRFVKFGTEKSFAHARQAEIEEYIYMLSEKSGT